MGDEFNKQFSLDKEYYLNHLDFLNWFRYYHLLKDVLSLQCSDLLEIGGGAGLLRNCLKPLISRYVMLDVNEKLCPDILADVRDPLDQLNNTFDCVIAADVLEHIPFESFEVVCRNMYDYLKPGGYLLITIPHRQSNFLFMSPRQILHVITVPTGFLSFGAFYRRFIKKKIWIDPDHCWEIGDGNIKVNDVDDCLLKCGFKIKKFTKLLYVDYWVLQKTPGKRCED